MGFFYYAATILRKQAYVTFFRNLIAWTLDSLDQLVILNDLQSSHPNLEK